MYFLTLSPSNFEIIGLTLLLTLLLTICLSFISIYKLGKPLIFVYVGNGFKSLLFILGNYLYLSEEKFIVALKTHYYISASFFTRCSIFYSPS
ncbi:hypothetical protein C2G38_595819 [Gigaspora rosea]|uniref:Uncharacterized protein n=1 Tax=Gigaspora rosea TaxID=44941 RepID=A0A397U590_9GLOM|nr:hypothetical protein C2G38_595819 [Gigaspora rosea]